MGMAELLPSFMLLVLLFFIAFVYFFQFGANDVRTKESSDALKTILSQAVMLQKTVSCLTSLFIIQLFKANVLFKYSSYLIGLRCYYITEKLHSC